jgi:hypothetical protein
LKFEEVSVLVPAGCSVASSIETTLLFIAADWMGGSTNYIEFEPIAGSTHEFAIAEIDGCALETILVPKGILFVQSQNATGIQAVEQEVHSSESINATAGGTLHNGAKTAVLAANAKFAMSGAKAGRAFGTH